jgi:prevent-host-death family protein
MKASNVRPITDLKNHTKELVQEVADGGQPVVITQNGKPKVVVMDVEQHDRLQETLAMLKLLAQSQDALAKTGRVYSSADVRRRARAALQKATPRK